MSEQKIAHKLEGLINIVKTKTGKDIKNFKPAFLERRILYRMRNLEITNYDEYVDTVSTSPDEAQFLYSHLSINVTKFFRDPGVWDFLKQIPIPELIRDSRHSISAWSCACASGEEPHSVSILLNESLKGKGLDYTVLATDISKTALAHSKKGVYRNANLVNVSPERLSVNFEKTPEDEFIVNQNIRNKIRYDEVDMMKSTEKGFDIIFCRNVLIYYDRDAHETIFKKFSDQLKQHGLLVLGQDESMIGTKGNEFFELLDPKQRVYKKITA